MTLGISILLYLLLLFINRSFIQSDNEFLQNSHRSVVSYVQGIILNKHYTFYIFYGYT